MTYAVKGVNELVLDKKSLGQCHEDGAALTKNQQRRTDGSKRSIEDGQHCCLGQIREEEHASDYANSHGQCWEKLRGERLP